MDTTSSRPLPFEAQELQAVLARSATDPAFRERLLRAPRQAVAAFTGRELGEDVEIRFVERGAEADPDAGAIIVLPDPAAPEAELSEAELSEAELSEAELSEAELSEDALDAVAGGGIIGMSWGELGRYVTSLWSDRS